MQTTLREGTARCAACKTRFRHSVDRGALLWSIWQIKKECIAVGDECAPSRCYCTDTAPYYSEEPKAGACSTHAKAVCRRKAFKCKYPSADYVVMAYEDYDILFCTVGAEDALPQCRGCVACTDPACRERAINVTNLISQPPADLTDPASYTCPSECHEAPRTCWNATCWDRDDCLPPCDPAVYLAREEGAGLGFYAQPGGGGKLVEEVKFPPPPHPFVLIGHAVSFTPY